jgi:hypothetical protein
LIPEFPLRRGTLWSETTEGASQSVKVDYLAFSLDRRRAYLVELKTDAGSGSLSLPMLWKFRANWGGFSRST